MLNVLLLVFRFHLGINVAIILHLIYDISVIVRPALLLLVELFVCVGGLISLQILLLWKFLSVHEFILSRLESIFLANDSITFRLLVIAFIIFRPALARLKFLLREMIGT